MEVAISQRDLMNNLPHTVTNDPRVFKRRHGFAFAAPSIAITFLFGPLALVQGIYAMHYGVALTGIAAVLLISRLFDAVTDPLIGYFSDRARARTGTRKPFICFGGVGLVVCSYFLFIPSGEVSIVYFAG
jgi:Na+/melibiose symporter-like transporter